MTGRSEVDEKSFFADFGASIPHSRIETTSAPVSEAPLPATDEKSASQNVDTTEVEEKPLYLGHRERARERFRKVGGENLADYELLELLLFRTIARGDTKDTAKRLLARFKTFAEVLGAPAHLLQEIKGVGEQSAYELKLIAAASQRIAHGAVHQKEVLSSWEKVIEYCRTSMAFGEVERFRVLYLNKKNALIADEVQQEGIVDHTPAYPSKVVNRAYNLGATAVILVHNHPSGDPSPSRADIDLTRTIASAAVGHGITVLDHIIVGRDGFSSLKALGYI